MDKIKEVTGEKRTRKRFFILFVVCIITCLNYLDRANIAVAGTSLQQDLQLDPVMMGIVFSTFGWTYTIMQIPTGWFIERLGPHVLYTFAIVGWSLFTGLTSLAMNFAMLIAFRLALGFFEAPAFPLNARIISDWFPQRERAQAISYYTAAEYIGLAFFTPFLAWIVQSFGWRMIFFGTGILGLFIAAIWHVTYSSPHNKKGVNKAELNYILDKENVRQASCKRSISFAEFRFFFLKRQLIGLYIGHFAVTSTLFFFMTWFPSYLVAERGMEILKAGIFTSLPFIAAIVGVLIGGRGSDALINRGYSLDVARKWPIIGGMLLSSCVIFANYIDNINAVVLIMCLAFAGQGVASTVAWALLSDIAPKDSIGIVGSIFNFCANLGGVISPLAVGIIIKYTGSFEAALSFIAIVALLGVVSYIFIIGKTHRIESFKEGLENEI